MGSLLQSQSVVLLRELLKLPGELASIISTKRESALAVLANA